MKHRETLGHYGGKPGIDVHVNGPLGLLMELTAAELAKAVDGNLPHIHSPMRELTATQARDILERVRVVSY